MTSMHCWRSAAVTLASLLLTLNSTMLSSAKDAAAIVYGYEFVRTMNCLLDNQNVVKRSEFVYTREERYTKVIYYY